MGAQYFHFSAEFSHNVGFLAITKAEQPLFVENLQVGEAILHRVSMKNVTLLFF